MHVVGLLRNCPTPDEVMVDPGAVPRTAVLAHMLRTSLKTAISCLTLQTWLMCLIRQTTKRVLFITSALVAALQQASLPLNQGTALEPPMSSELSGLALHRHWHIDDSEIRLLDHFHDFFHDLWYGDVDNLLHGASLNALQWNQSDNFNDLVHDLRNALNRHLRLVVWTQPQKITSITSSVSSLESSNVMILITSANVKIIIADVAIHLQCQGSAC